MMPDDGHESHRPLSHLLKVDGRSVHGALSYSFEHGPDFFPDLLNGVLEDERWAYWESGDKNFELRCSGTPGCGKTNLAALAAKTLREKYSGRRDAVASVFIQHDIRWNESAFIEDLLVCILHQLSEKHTCTGSEKDCLLYEETVQYVKACQVGQRTANRIRLVRQALDTCISSLEHSFLILDGFDHCNAAVEIFLEEEFIRARAKGLKVMTTSRIPCLREPLAGSWYNCDGQECDDPEDRKICWLCQRCQTDTYFFSLCSQCKQKGEMCTNCGEKTNFVQPYDHVDLNISLASEETMSKFLAWNIENEHGDLGLGSGDEPKPSLSRLGVDIKRSPNEREAQNLVDRVAGRAQDNITLALARLDLIHDAATVEATKLVSDRLPSTITALFDAGIRAIDAQPAEHRDLGLKAIAAVAHSGAHNCKGIKHKDLDRWLREAEMLSSTTTLRRVPHRSLEEILHATKGFLIATVPAGEDERFVEGYHEDFVIYASGGYSESLTWATSQLQFDKLLNLGKFSRSKTVQFGETGSAIRERNQRVFNKKGMQPIVTIERIGTGRYQSDETRALHIKRRGTGWA